jgi:hypothetical protein
MHVRCCGYERVLATRKVDAGVNTQWRPYRRSTSGKLRCSALLGRSHGTLITLYIFEVGRVNEAASNAILAVASEPELAPMRLASTYSKNFL